MKRYLVSLLLINICWCSPITFELHKSQTECFYMLTPEPYCRITYYFAVQSGQSHDNGIDHKIYDPNEVVIIEKFGNRLGEWSFRGEQSGEYAFCFNGGDEYNKVVDLEAVYECDNQNEDIWPQRRRVRRDPKRFRGLHKDPIWSSVENSADKIEEQLYQLENNLMYYKARSKRSQHTLRSADLRIMLFSLYSILLVIGIGLAEILILRSFFQESRKHAI